MKLSVLTAVAPAALAVLATLALPAVAADLGGPRSVKDGYAPMPSYGTVSSCYFRGDVGGSFSADPDIRWPVTDAGGSLITDKVSNASIDNTWLIETGIGCGSGSRGLRADVTLGYHGQRSIEGTTGPWTGATATANAKLHSSLTTYTAMLNGYYDLGRWNAFVPYVGAGVGLAYHQMHEVSFTDHPDLTGVIAGDNDVSFAWSLMAGVGYQISDRAILDFGYRYIDMGQAASARHDNGGTTTNPKVVVDDIAAHEFKVGLRYHFGGSSCCAEPMK
jgi:opacity protein-like surface antigen